MLKRTVEISTEGTRLYLKQRQLVIERDEEILSTVPFEDLGFLILSSRGITISTGALRFAAESNVAVITCAENFMPVGLQLPIDGNSLHAVRLAAQVAATEPLKRQLWTAIISAKIRMQAALHNGQTKTRILGFAAKVKSGDAGNIEAQAARLHWKNLFADCELPAPFRRERDGKPPNGLLNYGYAIVRACVARALVAAGLHPALGLHHHNKYNAFALADDLIEPFRPIVDSRVIELVSEGSLEVDKQTKPRLLTLLAEKITVGKELSPLMIGAQRTANSLSEILLDAANPECKSSASELAKRLKLPQPSDTK